MYYYYVLLLCITTTAAAAADKGKEQKIANTGQFVLFVLSPLSHFDITVYVHFAVSAFIYYCSS